MLLLGPRHRLLGLTVRNIAAGLHLYKDKAILLFKNKVDFSKAGTKIPGQEFIAFLQKIFFRCRLSGESEGDVGDTVRG